MPELTPIPPEEPEAEAGKNGDHGTGTAFEKLFHIGLFAAMVLGLYLTSLHSYLLFHSLIEIITIAIGFTLFILTLNTRRYLANNYLKLLGIGYAFIALIDLIHTLAYKGMNVFPGYGANLPTQLWIAARYLQAVTLLAAPLLVERTVNNRFIIAGYAAAVSMLVAMIYSGNFPDCFIEGGGLTTFKIASEYLITALLLASLYLFHRKRNYFKGRVFVLVASSIACTAISEISFTAYASVYGFANMIGHFSKLAAFYLVYRAILVTGLKEPFDLIFRELKQAEEALQKAYGTLEEKVRERTEELHIQAVELEQEVAERQTAQESLQEQALLLEEEITERRQVEEKLRIIFDAAQAGIIMVDADGVITFANRHVSRLYGFEPVEMVGSGYVEHVHPDEREASGTLIQRLIAGDIESISVERHYLCQKGGDFWGFLNAKRHLDDGGRLISIIIVITDITELRAAQSERDSLQLKFNQAQKMEAIGRLAGGVAHDFNNKLAIIMGYTELLKTHAKNLDEEQITQLNEILKAAKHSCEITRQLLAFSRSEVISPRKVSLNTIIEDSRKSLGRFIGEDIRFEFKPATDIWPTLLDPTQIDQIVMNLAVNARDAMPDGGLFSIETKNVHIDETCAHEFPSAQPGDYVQISVSDNGSGMDKETLTHIFEPFFTTKEAGKGTGLGLATIFGIVSQNKGFLNVYSEVGSGTTFKIYFPRMALENEDSAALCAETAAVSGSGTVLLVEDDERLRELAYAMLRQLGYSVLEAHSPAEAMELCRSQDNNKIDMILTDVIMPGMNGKEMCDRIQEIQPNIPVLFMSGYTADVIASKGIMEGSVHLIQKPFSLQKLSLMMRETMGQ